MSTKYPDFIPMEFSERSGRQRSGFIAQTLLWGYAAVVLVRIVFFDIFMGRIESLALDSEWSNFPVRLTKWFDFDARYFEMSWPSIFITFVVGSVIGAAIGMTGRGAGAWITSLSRVKVNNPEDSIKIKNYWSYARKEGLFFLLITLIAGWVITRINLATLFESEGLKGAGRLILQIGCGIPGVGAILPWGHSVFDMAQALVNGFVSVTNAIGGVFGSAPADHFNLMCTPSGAEYFGNALKLLTESVYLAFMATVFAVPVAFVLSFFAARNLTRHSFLLRLTYSLVRAYMNISRSIEPLIWAILFAVWIGIGPMAGAISLMVHSVSSLVKQYSEAIENVDEGPIEAMESVGASRIATAWFAIVPQVVMPFLAFTIYRWDINVRMATIIGLVGGGGIGGLLIQEQGLAHWTQVGSIAFLIFIVVWTMDFMSARIREAIQ